MEGWKEYDLNRLKELYNDSSNNKKLTTCKNGDDFIKLIFNRQDIIPKGDDLSSLVTRETHYALSHLGFESKNGIFTGFSHKEYLIYRDLLLGAIINKVHDLCEYNSCSRISMDYKLESYVDLGFKPLKYGRSK